MLLDDVTIRVKAGDGGAGTVAFNGNMKELGPVGGAGGRGGSVWCTGTADIGALSRWRNSKEAVAEGGGKGQVQYRDGTDGADLDFTVPVGTVIHNLTTGIDSEVSAVGQKVQLARGGGGGYGNYHYRSSLDTSPRRADKGRKGEEFKVRLELKLIADLGLIGMPNAGKSSLLNEFTRAQSKVANYPFTTLEPSLGVYYGLVLADIPGLIEGASSGKGLGFRFLKHVERTRALLHLVSAESDDAVRDWRTVRGEMGAYQPALLEKPETVLITKTDLVPRETVDRLLKQFRDAGCDVMAFSIHDPAAHEALHAFLRGLVAAKQA